MKNIILMISLVVICQFGYTQGSIDIDTEIQMGILNKEHVKITSNSFNIHNDNPSQPLIFGDFGTGNVGIGTNNPQSALHVEGDLKVGSGNSISVMETGVWQVTGYLVNNNNLYVRKARYVKINDVVYLYADIDYANVADYSKVRFGGLPFTPNADSFLDVLYDSVNKRGYSLIKNGDLLMDSCKSNSGSEFDYNSIRNDRIILKGFYTTDE